ncbi:unnamed protein product [Rotaria socialis]|uniref:Reverse transcriptase domain-containing protein n=1 Tax=Rotaria socialis TaxID=392032 RepID=A0A820VVZ4_9BILA|nr:unnamed protein product [Rotaria socialis]
MDDKQLRNSSCGPDNIHTRCLKNYTELLIKHLTKLFNFILNIGYVPNGWKKANIILLLKPNEDKQQPSSYRPISLLSCLGKRLEKIMKQRLMNILEQRNILPEHQAGFRPKKSTLNNIIRLTKYARNNLEQNGRRRHSAVILFDIKAAFDSVWHDGLIYKLNELRIPKYLMYYLISFLQNRTASIEIENSLSKLLHLNSGTPQGSPLSPLLYIIYTADSMNGVPEHTQYDLFADDTALWTSPNITSSLSSRLQQASDAFQSWCKSWKLKLQPTKTELVHFTLHPRRKFKNPIIKSKIAGRISLLKFLSKASYEPNDKIMLNIFKAIARTILLYGYPILLQANDKIWERLQIIQNKSIRAALGLPIYTSVEYIHQVSNVPKIKEYAVSLLQRYIQTTTSSNDITLKNNLEEIFNQLRK